MADEPVAAHPDSMLQSVGRGIRRHKTVAASIAVLAATLTVASLFGMILVNAEKNRTVAALDLVSQEKLKTEKALAAETVARRQARETLNTVTDDFVGELLAQKAELNSEDEAFLIAF